LRFWRLFRFLHTHHRERLICAFYNDMHFLYLLMACRPGCHRHLQPFHAAIWWWQDPGQGCCCHPSSRPPRHSYFRRYNVSSMRKENEV
jgi:hypothetical protein